MFLKINVRYVCELHERPGPDFLHQGPKVSTGLETRSSAFGNSAHLSSLARGSSPEELMALASDTGALASCSFASAANGLQAALYEPHTVRASMELRFDPPRVCPAQSDL